MAVITKKTRIAAISAGIVVAIVAIGLVAWFWYWHIVDSRNPYGGHNSYGMRDYTPAVQEKGRPADRLGTEHQKSRQRRATSIPRAPGVRRS
jgi:hypothetical protein